MSQVEQRPATATGTPGSVYAAMDVAQAWRAARMAVASALGGTYGRLHSHREPRTQRV